MNEDKQKHDRRNVSVFKHGNFPPNKLLANSKKIRKSTVLNEIETKERILEEINTLKKMQRKSNYLTLVAYVLLVGFGAWFMQSDPQPTYIGSMYFGAGIGLIIAKLIYWKGNAEQKLLNRVESLLKSS